MKKLLIFCLTIMLLMLWTGTAVVGRDDHKPDKHDGDINNNSLNHNNSESKSKIINSGNINNSDTFDNFNNNTIVDGDVSVDLTIEAQEREFANPGNINYGSLINYYGISLTRDVPSGPVWNPRTHTWHTYFRTRRR